MTYETPFGAFLAVFIIGAVLSWSLNRAAIRLGMRWNIIDEPRGRHHHRQTVSKFGGMALWGAFTVAALIGQALPVPRTDPMELVRVTGLLAGGTVCFLFGILDDIFEFPWFPQYLAQLAAASIAVIFQIFIQYVNNPFTNLPTEEWPHLFTVFVTVLWMGIMMNAVNFMDGLDGLAAGVAGISAMVLFVNSVFRLNPPQHSVGLLPVALIGATMGFLPANFAPAKVFMGTSGSMFLGYTLGALAIIGGAKMATILLVMGLPLLDFTWVVANRIRMGRNPLTGDRSHLHYRLLDIGLTQRQIVLGYWAFSAVFGTITLITESRVFKLVAIIAMGLLVLVGFMILQQRSQE